MPKPKKLPLTTEERMTRDREHQHLSNRRKRFVELLGEDNGYIEALVAARNISPWDIKGLLDNGCPKDLAPKILL